MQNSIKNIQYWTYGDRNNRPLLLIHGFTGSHEGFQYIIPRLQKDFYIIAPDLSGFGKSPLDFTPWTADALAKRMNEFVEAFRFEVKSVLISHSLGGLVAASMLDQRPDLFAEKTIFVSPVATAIGWFDSRKIGALAGAAQYAIGRKTGRFGDKLVRNRMLSRIATIAIMTEKNKAMRRKIFKHHFDNLNYISSIDYYHQLYKDITSRGAVDYAQSLKNFTVLIIAGNKDNVTPLKGEKLLANTIDAQLNVIPDVGHLAHYERPDEISQAVIDFLQ